jgi:hypothetical protein
VTRQVRAGCMLLLPVYIWIMVFIGYERPGGSPATIWSSQMGTALATALAVLGIIAVVQLLELPFRTTASYSIFRLAVINTKGERAERTRLYLRWAIVWLPLFVPILVVALLIESAGGVAFLSALTWLLLWIGAAVYAVIHPSRGLPDRLAGTWVVRQ